jgi:hypothetical protein
VVLVVAVDREQLVSGLGHAHDDHVPVVAGHLEVDVGQPAGELDDLTRAPPDALEPVEHLVVLLHPGERRSAPTMCLDVMPPRHE